MVQFATTLSTFRFLEEIQRKPPDGELSGGFAVIRSEKRSEPVVNVKHRPLDHFPGTRLGIPLAVGERQPIFFHGRRIGTEVVSGPTGFFAEQDGAHVRFRLPHPLHVFPTAHQLMQVLRRQLHRVLFQ